MELVYLFVLICILLFLIRNKNIENFIDSNFNLCKKNDCECLKLTRAPNGTCVDYDISAMPLIPEYENKKVYKNHVVRNNKYPKKKDKCILIFVGIKMRNREKIYDSMPNLVKRFEDKETGRYSEDPKCNAMLEIFLNATEVCEMLDGKKPFLKWIILDCGNFGQEKAIMDSYKLDREKYPAIYLYNEFTNEMKTFQIDKSQEPCFILQDLMLFIADGDCGLISYLNHLQDPFLGMKFYHNSKKNEWVPHPKHGVSVMPNGTNLCKLIDYKDLDENFKCKN